MQAPLRIDRDGHVVVWTVDRPAARNAIDGDTALALEAALDGVKRDRSVRAVVLTGAGDRAFVAGADLKFLRSASAAERTLLDHRMFSLTSEFERLPVPIIAALNGVVMGGGCEVAVACDVRIGASNASFTFKHAALGVSPGWGGLGRLATLVGRGAAAGLLLTAEAMPAEQALRVGLLDELAADPRARALELAAQVAANAPRSIAHMKRLLWNAYRGQLDPQDERETFLRRALEADHAAALTALTSGNAPDFQERE